MQQQLQKEVFKEKRKRLFCCKQQEGGAPKKMAKGAKGPPPKGVPRPKSGMPEGEEGNTVKCIFFVYFFFSPKKKKEAGKFLPVLPSRIVSTALRRKCEKQWTRFELDAKKARLFSRESCQEKVCLAWNVGLFRVLSFLFEGPPPAASSAATKKSLGAQFKDSLILLYTVIANTNPHYVRCGTTKNDFFPSLVLALISGSFSSESKQCVQGSDF